MGSRLTREDFKIAAREYLAERLVPARRGEVHRRVVRKHLYEHLEKKYPSQFCELDLKPYAVGVLITEITRQGEPKLYGWRFEP